MWHLDKLIIYNSNNTAIELPRTREITYADHQVFKEITTADGSRKRYVIGSRPEVIATWDYFPAELLTQVSNLARSCAFYQLDYPGIDGTDKTGLFSVATSTVGVFMYRNGRPVWHGLTLTFTAQNVERV